MKLKTSNRILVELKDWDNLVQETYGKIYSFQQQNGCQERGLVNFSVPDEPYAEFTDEIPFEVNGEEMGVSFETWLKTNPEDTKNHFIDNSEWRNNLFWERNFYPELQEVANDLYKKGLIDKGNYSINIDW